MKKITYAIILFIVCNGLHAQVHWQNVCDSIHGVNALLTDGEGDVYATNGSFYSSFKGTNWNRRFDLYVANFNNIPCPSPFNFLLKNKDGLYAETDVDCYDGWDNSFLLISKDTGKNWNQISYTYSLIGPSLTNTKGEIFFAAYPGQLSQDIRDTVSGGVIRMVTSPNTVSTICDTGLGVHAFRVQALAVDRNGYLYAGTDTGIYRSTDDGNHWIWSNLPDTISSIAASSNGYIYAQTFYDSYDSSATYISYDTGATWKYLNSDLVSCGLYSSPTNAIIGLGSYNDTSRTDYVFSLDIVTGHWFRIDQELPADHQYYSIAIDSSGYIYAADENNGIYRTTSPVTSVYEENNVIASAFNLSPNYPNPFSEMTNVEYQIPVEGFVTLKVYNTLGEEVATLVNGEQSAGEHSAAFNASGLRNGVYFYRLTAGKYSQTGKMCVVK